MTRRCPGPRCPVVIPAGRRLCHFCARGCMRPTLAELLGRPWCARMMRSGHPCARSAGHVAECRDYATLERARQAKSGSMSVRRRPTAARAARYDAGVGVRDTQPHEPGRLPLTPVAGGPAHSRGVSA